MAGSESVHVTLFAVGSRGEEDAVLAGLFFDEAVAQSDAMEVFFLEGGEGHLEKIG